jgi:hypothetical protein
VQGQLCTEFRSALSVYSEHLSLSSETQRNFCRGCGLGLFVRCHMHWHRPFLPIHRFGGLAAAFGLIWPRSVRCGRRLARPPPPRRAPPARRRTAEQLTGAHPRPAQEAPRPAPLTCASSRVWRDRPGGEGRGGCTGGAVAERQQAADGSLAPLTAPHRPTLSALGGLPGNAAHLAHRRAFVWVSAAHYRAD